VGDYIRGFEDACELIHSLTIEKKKYSDFKKELTEIIGKLKERKFSFIYDKVVLY